MNDTNTPEVRLDEDTEVTDNHENVFLLSLLTVGKPATVREMENKLSNWDRRFILKVAKQLKTTNRVKFSGTREQLVEPVVEIPLEIVIDVPKAESGGDGT